MIAIIGFVFQDFDLLDYLDVMPTSRSRSERDIVVKDVLTHSHAPEGLPCPP
jgi:hypothetical protein